MRKEISIMKDVPIVKLDSVLSSYRDTGTKIRIRYRGPRFGTGHHTLKQDAVAFSVYARK